MNYYGYSNILDIICQGYAGLLFLIDVKIIGSKLRKFKSYSKQFVFFSRLISILILFNDTFRLTVVCLYDFFFLKMICVFYVLIIHIIDLLKFLINSTR